MINKSQPNICPKCEKEYHTLHKIGESWERVIHTCCEHKNTTELEDDNGNKARGCNDCGEVV